MVKMICGNQIGIQKQGNLTEYGGKFPVVERTLVIQTGKPGKTYARAVLVEIFDILDILLFDAGIRCMDNTPHKQFGKIISSILVGAGVLLLGLSLIPGVGMKITLPLVFWMSGAALILMVFVLSPDFRWAGYLFIPGCILLALGIIFLLNVISGDWNAWAYAWLLILSGSGVGMILAGRRITWPWQINLVGGGLVGVGTVFFVIFGAIAGGLFIQIMAPILLIAGGLALRWVGIEKILSGRFFHTTLEQPVVVDGLSLKPAQSRLVEPLSSREIEVLRLIDQGLSNMEIANRLTLAQSTVKTHINNIYSKLEVQTRVQAIKRGHELGLLD
jgi:DNA-binding CsgD family transcriptional regulator